MRISEILIEAGYEKTKLDCAKKFVKLAITEECSRTMSKSVFKERIGPEDWFNTMWPEK